MIVTVVGARPQFIKAAAVSKALIDSDVAERIIHTGQHYDINMSDVFWKELGIPKPTINLAVGSGNHGEQTAKMITGIENYILENIKIVSGILLYGDTNSTLAGAIVGSKLNDIPVYHVEAGLRSFNRNMPEEVNRVLTDQISDVCFCPSDEAMANLRNEGRSNGIVNVGDVMLDAMILFKSLSRSPIEVELPASFGLLTVHRPSNTSSIVTVQGILDSVASELKYTVWPVHPRCQPMISKLDIPQNILVTTPLSYLEMLFILERCEIVVTDSGGLQKEAYWMKKKCVTLRSDTEWVETLHGNWNSLVGNQMEDIVAGLRKSVDREWKPLYGEGKAAQKIAEVISNRNGA